MNRHFRKQIPPFLLPVVFLTAILSQPTLAQFPIQSPPNHAVLLPSSHYSKTGWGISRKESLLSRPLSPSQLEAVEETKKLLPKNDNDVKSIEVHQTQTGMWISITTADYPRYEFYKAKNKKPVIFFHQECRGIDVIPGNRGELLVVNDCPAVIGSQVMMADLKTGKLWKIDGLAEKNYQQKHRVNKGGRRKGPQLFFAVGISPDDRKVLIQSMDMEYGVPNHEYKPWFYVVDAISGKILEVHESAQESFALYNKDWKNGL